MLRQDFAEIGKIIKTHGIHGELILELINPDIIENIKESVFIEIDGLPVPFFIESISSRSTVRYRVKFEWINTEREVKKLIGLSVLLQTDLLISNTSDLSNTPSLLVGFTAYSSEHGELGEIIDLIENEINPLLVVSHNKTELLIPLHEDLIVGIDANEKLIELNIPDGLLDLN